MAGGSATPSHCAIAVPSARCAITTRTPKTPLDRARRRVRPGRRRKRRFIVERRAFDALVADALAGIPPKFREALANLAISVEPEPSRALLHEMGIEPPETLL